MNNMKVRSFVIGLLATNSIIYVGRLVYAVVLTAAAAAMRLWISAEEVGSTVWAFRSLISWQETIPYLIWGTFAAIVNFLMRCKYSTKVIQTTLLLVMVGLWLHTTQLSILSKTHWETSWILELFWGIVFFPLFWYLPFLSWRLEQRFATEVCDET